ncbi:MAG TPA: FimV/HubP family polar landmark protein [Steroidobacteraceae bacterium]
MLRRLGYQFLLLGLAPPGVALALGLGDIHVESALHQPLAAQIELVGVTPENAAGLSAGIADEEMFHRHGLERPTVLTSTAVTVRQDQQGHTVLVLRSTDVFSEPMVTFLVDLHSPGGELIREYTVFLDPTGLTPEHGNVESAAAAPAAQPAPVAATRAQTPAVATAPVVESPVSGTYTAARRDTLARIATIAGAHSRAARHKMMIAIFRANPAAFQTNLNMLRTGAKLHLPSAAELAQISTDAANREFAAQMAAWRASDHRVAASPAASSATAPTPFVDTKADIDARDAATKALTQRIATLEKSLHELQEDLKAPPAEQVAAPMATAAARPARAEPAEQFQSAADEPAPAPRRSFRFAPIAVSLGLALVAGIWLYLRRRTDEDDASYQHSTLNEDRSDAARAVPFEKIDMSATYLVEEARHEAGQTNETAEVDARTSDVNARTAYANALTVELPADIALPPGFSAASDDATVKINNAAANIEPTVKLPSARILDVETTAILALQAEIDDDTAAREFAFFNPESGHNIQDTHVMLASGLDEAPKPFVERRKSPADALRQAIEREPERNDLRLKLLELYYQAAAQNRRAFLDAVRQLAKNDKFSSPNDWSQIEDMGRAIAPDDDLFSNGKDTDKKAVA